MLWLLVAWNDDVTPSPVFCPLAFHSLFLFSFLVVPFFADGLLAKMRASLARLGVCVVLAFFRSVDLIGSVRLFTLQLLGLK